uniref:ORF50 n=1 Tax=Chlamydomonas reinhardtii TaxID=3055 RepID=Q32060_CHLRE|nr:ORF50; hypothetical; Method: conceptual translation supplied by author [Chlamydomonas reinhardtii]
MPEASKDVPKREAEGHTHFTVRSQTTQTILLYGYFSKDDNNFFKENRQKF